MEEKNISFIWDSEKEATNIRKHGVDFTTATKVFKDINRKIYTDSLHSLKEPRYFCIGKIDDKILTVRFMYRKNKIRIIGAGYWRKGRKHYEKEKT